MLPGLLPGGPESGESTLEKINELSPENKRPDSPSELENPPVNKATVPKSAANSPYFSDNPEVKRARARDLLSMPFLKPEERKVLGEILAQDEKKK